MKRLRKSTFLLFVVTLFAVSLFAQENAPKVLKHENPMYSGAAIVIGADGEVVVNVVIDITGKVLSAQAESGHVFLRKASELAAQAWLFSKGRDGMRSAQLLFLYRIKANKDFRNNYKDTSYKYRFRRPYKMEIEATVYPRINVHSPMDK
jgi:hypothetical protein